MHKTINPPFSWLGGKRRHLAWLKTLFLRPEDGISSFIDCCGGAGVVALNCREYYRVIYNDIYSDVVNFYRVLRDPEQSAALINGLRLTPFAREEYDRAHERTATDPVEKARHFYIRCQQGFSGFENKKSFKTSRIVSSGFSVSSFQNTVTAAQELAGFLGDWIMFENLPVAKLISKYDAPENLLYVDPPYPDAVRADESSGTQYTSDASTWEWHVALAKSLSNVQSKVAVSCYASDDYAALFDGWHRSDGEVYGTCIQTVKGRDRQEMLLTNYEPPIMHQSQLF